MILLFKIRIDCMMCALTGNAMFGFGWRQAFHKKRKADFYTVL